MNFKAFKKAVKKGVTKFRVVSDDDNNFQAGDIVTYKGMWCGKIPCFYKDNEEEWFALKYDEVELVE